MDLCCRITGSFTGARGVSRQNKYVLRFKERNGHPCQVFTIRWNVCFITSFTVQTNLREGKKFYSTVGVVIYDKFYYTVGCPRLTRITVFHYLIHVWGGWEGGCLTSAPSPLEAGRQPLDQAGTPPPGEMATAADGMQSSYWNAFFLILVLPARVAYLNLCKVN